jgi:UDP-GlcNAc:undecaprenyl-phosphate GlcNAc-1-phosphate transferase
MLPLAAAALVAAGATPLAARLALMLDVVDRPGDRKVNVRHGIPLLGGLAVAVGVFAGVLAFHFSGDPAALDVRILGYGIGAVTLVAVGAWDDRFYLNAWQKLPFQIAVAAVAIASGFSIDYFTNPFTATTSPLPVWVAWPVTLLWILAVTNAMNLIDGLDGLSAGTGAIIAGTLAVICWQAGQPTGVVIGVAMLGALVGFLPYNFPPARIFLGDAGALFIGYSLALASIQGYRKVALLTFIVPFLVLAVPLLDTSLSIVRRLRMGKGIFDADRMHMHHRLLEKEGTQRRAVLWLYFQTACYCLIAVSFAQLGGLAAYVFLGAVVILTVRLLRNLGLLSIDVDDAKADGGHKELEGEKT